MNPISEAFAQAIQQNAPSIVRVDARRHGASSGLVFSEGIIVTAAHTLDRDEGIEVGLPDGRSVPATLKGFDGGTDLALLSVEEKGLTPARFADDVASVRVGHLAFVAARPGKTVRAGLGIVSAISEGEWRTPTGGRLARYLSTDVDSQPGFSGGAVIDEGGLLLGLHTAGILRRVGVVIPKETIDRVVAAIAKEGRVSRGFLGVGAQPVRLPEAIEGHDAALLVVAVQKDGPAAKGGILLGDALLELDGQAVSHVGELHGLLDDRRVGKAIPVKLLRAGEVKSLDVTVGVRP